MNFQACAKWGTSVGVACILAVAALGPPAAAEAAPLNTMSVNGQTLGSTALQRGAFIVTVDAPVGVTVKFKMDGQYLGEDRAAPYSWPIVTGAGDHKISARWELNGRQEVGTAFVVAAAPVAAPAVIRALPTDAAPVAPAPKPAAVAPAPTTPAITSILMIDGTYLASSIQPSGTFSVMVNAPAGSVVKFKIDGSYLGQDNSAPYTWPVVTGAGSHLIKARWDGGEAESQFTVRAAVPGIPAPVVGAPASDTRTVHVSTSAQLIAALKSAAPGQMIALADGRYVGKFEATTSGTQAAPITLTGSRAAVLSSGAVSSGYGLHITGSNWRVTGISVTNSSKGIVLDGSKHTTISSVDVGNVGAEAVHFRSNSSDGVIENSVIHDTGLRQPGYGEGIYIGSANSNWGSIMGSQLIADRSDRVIVRNNRISNTSAEGIDVKEGTTGGSITGNVFSNAGYSGQNFADSWVDVKGNAYTVTANSGAGTLLDAFQVHGVLSGWGRGNTFTSNSVLGGVPGYEVWIQSASLGNVVGCKASGATKGISNIRCSL